MMASPGGDTPYALLGGYPDRTQPLVTHYAGPDARVELSVASTANAVAKAAGLLRDSLGLGPGTTLSVDLPRHWQLPVWLMAGLSVGAACGRELPGHVDVRITDPPGLVAPAAADELLACSCDTFGLPVPGGVPAGVIDVGLEVRAHPDVLQVEPGAAGAAAVVLAEGTLPWPEALARSRSAGWPSGARLWVDDATDADELIPRTCLVPLAVRGSVVIGTGLAAGEAARIRDVEGAGQPEG
jgi:uncharacterized protein (TIGR03089 family)